MNDQIAKPLTESERLASRKALNQLHPGNRFRLMFGQPLLPQEDFMPSEFQSTTPPSDRVIIATRQDGKTDQVEIRGETVYLWRYKSTPDIFCRKDEIIEWRGCTGFDF